MQSKNNYLFLSQPSLRHAWLGRKQKGKEKKMAVLMTTEKTLIEETKKQYSGIH
jgi:hypothetical protein